MKIRHFGYEGSVSCIKSLNIALQNIGATIIQNDEPDLILDIHGFPTEAIKYSKLYPKAKKIFGLLNADVKNSNWPEKQAKEELSLADVRVTVSKSCARDLLDRIGLDFEVIYFPMKDVYPEDFIKDTEFLWCGRLRNHEKRFGLAYEALKMIDCVPEKMKIVGPEPLNGFDNMGFVAEHELNEYYNKSKFLLAPCEREGPMAMIEAACANDCIPVMCNDNLWAHEFGFSEFCSNPNPLDYAKKIIEIENNRIHYNNLLEKLRPDLISKFNVKNVAQQIISLYDKVK